MTDSEQTDITWAQETASGATNCVEVAHDSVLIRNSQDPLGAVLSFTHQEWATFLKGVNNGEFMLNRTGNEAFWH